MIARLEGVLGNVSRAGAIFASLAVAVPESQRYRAFVLGSGDRLSRALRDLGRFDDAQAIEEALGDIGEAHTSRV